MFILWSRYCFLYYDEIFRDDSSPIHTARSVHSWLEEHEGALQHLPWAAQLPDFSIIVPVWSVVKSRVRSCYPPPSSLKQLEDDFREELYSIPLGLFRTYMSLFQEGYKLYYRQMVAKLRINNEMCVFSQLLLSSSVTWG